MRWKVLLIATLLATVVSAGGILTIGQWILGSPNRIRHPDLYVLVTLIIPVLAIAGASIFVYRHTARRRRLQAMATALLAIILTLGVVIITSMLTAEPMPQPPEPTREAG